MRDAMRRPETVEMVCAELMSQCLVSTKSMRPVPVRRGFGLAGRSTAAGIRISSDAAGAGSAGDDGPLPSIDTVGRMRFTPSAGGADTGGRPTDELGGNGGIVSADETDGGSRSAARSSAMDALSSGGRAAAAISVLRAVGGESVFGGRVE